MTERKNENFAVARAEANRQTEAFPNVNARLFPTQLKTYTRPFNPKGKNAKRKVNYKEFCKLLLLLDLGASAIEQPPPSPTRLSDCKTCINNVLAKKKKKTQ